MPGSLVGWIGLLLAFAGLGRTAPARAGEEPVKPLAWAADSEGGAPYIFRSADNVEKNVGFEVDLTEALAEELGRPIRFKQYAFQSLVPGLLRRDFDFAMNGLEVTPDRVKAVRFTRPYYIYSLQLVVRKDQMGLDSLDACQQAGAVVGTLEDTAAARLLEQRSIRCKTYQNQVEPYLDLELGRLDAVLLDLPIAAYYARPRPTLKFVGQPLGRGQYAIAFRREDEALAARFDAAIGRLLANGRLRRIYEKWHIWNDDQLRLAALGPPRPGDPPEGAARLAAREGGPADQPVSTDILRDSERKWHLAGYLPTLLRGALVTVLLSVSGMALAVALALPIALMRLYGPLPLRAAATLYVEFFRGIPVLLLLFFLYYGLPVISENLQTWGLPLSLNLGAIPAAILGFGLNYAAYEAEIYRAGIRSIPVGQWEAAASLGMSRPLTFRRIILPQAIRVILPPMTNDFVALFKDTSIVSIIAVEELSKQYQILAKSSLKYFEIGLVTAILYLVMSVPLGYLSRYLERRWGKGT